MWHSVPVSRSKIPRCPYKPFHLLRYEDEPVLNVSGEIWRIVSDGFAPTASESRDSLLRLRGELHWSRSALAAFMGVPKDTLRRWETGQRNPCGAARRLIWLLSVLACQPEKLKTGLDVIFWGQTGENLEFGRKIGIIEAEPPSATAEPA